MSDDKMIKMVNQKNIIKALNEQKYLRNLQNDFKPKMFFKENRSKAPIRVVEPKSYSAESSAHTINESIFTDDISPFSSYSNNSTGSTFMTLDNSEDSNNGSDNTTNDDDSLSKSTKIITDIFDKYSESKTDSLTDSILNTPSDSPRDLSDKNVIPISPDNPNKNGSSKLPSFINSNDLFKSATQNNKDKKKLIQRIFVKSPDYTSSVETDISPASADGNNSKNLSSVYSEKSTNPLYSADSIDESKIKIKRKNRVLIKKNIIKGKVSELIPLKISFFGGSYSNSDETMSYEKCKTVIQSLIEENISVNLKTFLNESLKNAGTTNTSTEPPKCAKEIEEKDKELKELQNKAEKLEIENKELKELQNKAKELEKPIEIGSTDMGLSELLNASLNKTVNPSQNDTGSNKLINESSNDMKLSELLNASLNGTVNPSQNSNQIINASLTGSSNAKPSAKDDQEYVVEITFDNETLEPIDIIINRANIFEIMKDEDKPSNYLFSVNQFIMEQIKTKNRGYILEGETTMACYLKDLKLDFDTAVFSF